MPETYVHRIGRTGRAGASGIAFSFCDDEEMEYLKDIQKLISKTIPVVEEQPYHMKAAEFKFTQPARKKTPEKKTRTSGGSGMSGANRRFSNKRPAAR